MLADSTCSRNPLYMYSYNSSHSDVTFIMRYWSEIEINVKKILIPFNTKGVFNVNWILFLHVFILCSFIIYNQSNITNITDISLKAVDFVL